MPWSDLFGLLGSAGSGASDAAIAKMGNFDPWAGNTLPSVTAATPADAAAAIQAGKSATGLTDAQVWAGNTLPATADTSGGWKWPSSKELAETLKGAGKSSGSSSSGSDDSIKGSSLVSSGAHAGSGGISSDTVYKLLMARATPTVGQQKQGLLGV